MIVPRDPVPYKSLSHRTHCTLASVPLSFRRRSFTFLSLFLLIFCLVLSLVLSFSINRISDARRLQEILIPQQMTAESWFHREFLTPRRLAFNVVFYGLHLFFFAYGWYTQVRGCLSSPLPQN